MDIIIFGGQSNMQGQTGCLPDVNMPVKGAWEYRIIENKLIELKHPVGEDYFPEMGVAAACEGGGTLIPEFCRTYIQETGRKVVAIHAARGNTKVEEWLKGTKRYENMAKKIRAGIDKAREIGEIKGVYYVWLQGESDAINGTSLETYVERLTEYKNSLKKDFGIIKFGIIKVGYFYSTSQWHRNISTYQEKRACDETIMLAQELAVERDRDFVMLTRVCTELSLDSRYINPEASGHYNNAGMDIIGRAAAMTLAKL